MTTHKLSPDFQERFAKISIDLGPNGCTESQGMELDINKLGNQRAPGGPRSGRKKTYPSHLYPGGTPNTNYTTPSKQPVLSTAKRAKSRNLSNQLKNASNSTAGNQTMTTPSRIPSQGFARPNDKSLSTIKPSKRIFSCPMSAGPHKTGDINQFSFMKETSSSIKKHVNVFNNGAGTSPTPMKISNEPLSVQKRVNSSGINRRRHQLEHGTRNTSGGSYSHGGRDRRIKSTQIPSTRPIDITNINYSVPTLKFIEIKSTGENLKVPSYKGLDNNTTYTTHYSPSKSRHVSQPFTQKSHQDVYNRLYNNANMAKVRAPNDLPKSPLDNKNKSSVHQLSNTDTPKVSDFQELLLLLYHEDYQLFSDGVSCSNVYTKIEPMEEQKLASTTSAPSGPLGIYERGEILRKKDIYYIPSENGDLKNDTRLINVRNYSENFGFDDKSGNYVIVPHDHVNYRYEIEGILGNGSFGNVVRCKDHKYVNDQNNSKIVAIKIIKNDINWSLQSVYETKMLRHLTEKANNEVNSSHLESSSLLMYIDHFHFRGHMCIVTEMLSLNLYSLLEIIKFRGMSLNIIKLLSKKILKGLDFIHKQNIIHCDIKPENIMIKLPSGFDPKISSVKEEDLVVKIIDFGSSCFEKEISYSYIQSRFYRAPEVILGANYSNKIDIWSFGCVVAELYSGTPLLPGKNEIEQIGLILEIFGAPNSSIILDYRTKLMKSAKINHAANHINSIIPGEIEHPVINKIPADEKAIKRTLLYRLFDLEGKINLQFLNMRNQADTNTLAFGSSGSSSVKKKFKLSSKSLEVLLRLNTSRENRKDSQLFSKFLHSIFKWDSAERSTAEELLADAFLQGR